MSTVPFPVNHPVEYCKNKTHDAFFNLQISLTNSVYLHDGYLGTLIVGNAFFFKTVFDSVSFTVKC